MAGSFIQFDMLQLSTSDTIKRHPRYSCLQLALYIYISLLLQESDCIPIVTATTTFTFPSCSGNTGRTQRWSPHHFTSTYSSAKRHHQRSIVHTNLSYSFIQQQPRLHRRTSAESLRHVYCLPKHSFHRRELLLPSIGTVLLQQRLKTSMASDSTTIPNDMDRMNAKFINQCRILCISDEDDTNNMILYNQQISDTNVVVHISSNLTKEDELESLIVIIKEKQINTIFISDASAKWMLAYILPRLFLHNKRSETQPQQHPIVWIHSRSAGIDSYLSPELIEWYQQGTVVTATFPSTTNTFGTVQMTNARGMFSSTLAEYSIGACTYFSKDFNRLKRNQQQRSWEKYSVSELRGSTIGIIGYGDIGRATARLAKAYGMKVLALVRQARLTIQDEYADELIVNDVANNDGMSRIFTESDYVLCALPLTKSTYRCIGESQFALCKPNCVFINVGRGPIVDEEALIAALQTKQLKGAALDVFAIEPLPISSPLWDMDNVLLSPHNMDQTDTFLLESTTFFVEEQIPRFIRGLPLLNHVNPTLGY